MPRDKNVPIAKRVSVYVSLFALVVLLTGCLGNLGPILGGGLPLNTYAVSGHVTDGTGGGVEGVVLSFGSDDGTAVTDADGAWSKSGLQGSVTITPAKDGYAFTPSSRTVEGADQAVDFTAESQGSQSPQGQIAFSDGSGIHIMNADGSNPTQVVTTPTGYRDFDPVWSPDGSQIAFVRDEGFTAAGTREIWVVDADATDLTQITSNDADDMEPAWSPDGTLIAFATQRDGDFNIYTMEPDGTNPVNLTGADDSGATCKTTANDPTWSPDGSKIAYSGYNWCLGNNDIYVIDVQGANVLEAVNLTNTADNEYSPAWSPDGSKIAFNSNDREGGYGVWVMNDDGSDPTRLTTGDTVQVVSSWSPDGSKILFFETIGSNIYVVKADGSDVQKVADGRYGSWID